MVCLYSTVSRASTGRLNSGGESHGGVIIHISCALAGMAWGSLGFPESLCSFPSLHVVLLCVFLQGSSVIQEQMFQQNKAEATWPLRMLKRNPPSKSGFIRWSSNQATSHLGTKSTSQRLYKLEGFYRKKSVELITEEKGWLVLVRDIFWGKREWRRAHMTDYPVTLDQKVADWLI